MALDDGTRSIEQQIAAGEHEATPVALIASVIVVVAIVALVAIALAALAYVLA